MQSALSTSGNSVNPSFCDTIIVDLHAPLTPYTLLTSDTLIVKTNGEAIAAFPTALNGSAVYIAIRGKNLVEIWSKEPIVLSSLTTFDFTGQ